MNQGHVQCSDTDNVHVDWLRIRLEVYHSGSQLVISGDVSVVKEEHIGDWEILEVTADCSKMVSPGPTAYDRANYIMLFHETTGYLVLISGESDMETLEHIAYEMEIRESSTPKIEYSENIPIGTIDLGRG